jgi:omega-amidase
MKIALCQLDMAWEDPEASKAKILSLLGACKEPFDWIVFPEMTLSGFSMDTAKTSTSSADVSFFADLARERSVWVSFGAVHDRFNRLVTLDRSGKTVSSYSKIHLYSFAGEDKSYRAGERQETFPLEGLSVTPAICFDLRFPQVFWGPAEKTDLFVVIASWPARRSEHWMTLLRARAIENQAYVVGVNRTGKDPTLEYSGNSMIYDPLGKVVLDCGTAEGISVAQASTDKTLVARTRERFPFFRDRKETARP